MTGFQMRENFQAWHDMDVEEGIEQGIEQGMIKGIEQGKQNVLVEMMKVKYPNEDYEWIRNCNESDLDKMSQLLLTDINYNDLKKRIIRN